MQVLQKHIQAIIKCYSTNWTKLWSQGTVVQEVTIYTNQNLYDLKKDDSFLHNTTALRPQKANISFPLWDVTPPMFYIHTHLQFLVKRSVDRLKKLPFPSRSPFILFPFCNCSFTYLEGDHLTYKEKYFFY
jgi:hypothetical protein